MNDSSGLWEELGREEIGLDYHNSGLEVRLEVNSQLVVDIDLAASTVAADRPNCLALNYMGIVLAVSYDTNLVSCGVVVIESIAVDRPAEVDCIVLSRERRLASAGWGYSLAALHRSLCLPSYRPLLRCC